MKILTIVFLFEFALFILSPPPARAWYPRLSADSMLSESLSARIVGQDRLYIIAPGEDLLDIAQRSQVGYDALTAANPTLDPWQPGEWEEVLLPYRTILPAGIAPGITINLAELRLFLIWNEDGRQRVRIYPIGIGQHGWSSPEGKFEITVRIEGPSWTPPASLRDETHDSATRPLSPDNPLGRFWLGLSAPGYGIHGTNRPYGVGRRVSHGCIRLYPKDIEDLFQRARVGMPVTITYQPIKLAADAKTLLVQVHPDFLNRVDNPLDTVQKMIGTLGWQEDVDRESLERIIEEARGVPVPVARSL